MNREQERLEELGYTVYVEYQNSFRLRGQQATLAGKPDLIAFNDAHAVIIDAKTGKPSPSHTAQVLIYQYAVPRALTQYNGIEFTGQLVYPDTRVSVPDSSTGGEFVRNLGALIRRLANDTPPRRVPSYDECRFCDITSADCPEHADEGEPTGKGTTDDF